MALVAAVACGGDAREGLTADSAVLQTRDSSGMVSPDSTTSDSANAAPDSGATDSATVTAPTFVLLADSAEGDVLYRRKGKCLSCHGLNGKGLEGLGANLQDSLWLHGDGSFSFIQRTIVEGIARPKVSPTVMPSFATALAPEEVYRIAAYVYTLSHPGVALADTTRAATDTIPRTDTIPPPVPPPTAPGAAVTFPPL
jgi:mono/diheme cytochrome c family protein